jgi:murein DD-endopeptidase MepM/ murein hydrolase activator NlpD
MPTLQDLIENFGISQPFGVEGPFGGVHTGVDLLTPSGTPIPAFDSGTIADVFYDSAGGQQVKVKYDSGAEGWFAHLSEVYGQPGERVSGSTIIGASGASGHVTGPHLHYEQRDPSGQLVDPLSHPLQTYIGGGGDPECPLGYSFDASTNSCKSWVPGGIVPNVPTGGSLPAWSPTAPALKPVDDAIRSVLPKNPLDAFGALSASVDKLGGDLARGTKQLAVAAVVIGVVIVLGYAGTRQVLD